MFCNKTPSTWAGNCLSLNSARLQEARTPGLRRGFSLWLISRGGDSQRLWVLKILTETDDKQAFSCPRSSPLGNSVFVSCLLHSRARQHFNGMLSSRAGESTYRDRAPLVCDCGRRTTWREHCLPCWLESFTSVRTQIKWVKCLSCLCSCSSASIM